ncbi:MAG TPA: cobalamin biosynthesis protein CbiM [Phycisphaerales bacterium]|nr:cobalamin biosynthesis protein CbiM [Phycisphaerales bacterium]
MHIQNELLSPPVAAGTCALASAALAFICRKGRKLINPEDLAMMGVLGAFIFAAQMVNFPLPLMPAASGHITGAVLLAIILGPYAASIVLSSVVIVQCLIFQDGGLLALGCNLINIAIVPSFVGYAIYDLFASRLRLHFSTIAACLAAVITGAGLVIIQAAISGVLKVPLMTFTVAMLSTYAIIGLIEGLITAAVLTYLRRTRPNFAIVPNASSPKLSRGSLYFTIIVITIITAVFLPLIASDKPDGLEWSSSHRSDQHAKLSPLPDYTLNAAGGHKNWTSFATVTGSAMTLILIYLSGRLIAKRNRNAPCPN